MTERFVYRMPVRFADTDAQGHVYFANYLTFCDEALAAYMRHVGCPWQDLVAAGVDMFYVNARCTYRGSATFEDELAIETRIVRFGNTSFDSELVVRSPAGETIAEAALTSVCITIADRRPTRVPDQLRDCVDRHGA